MLIKKIIAQNFIYPGKQVFEFDMENNLTKGNFINKEVAVDLIDLLNGEWRSHKLSFSKYYPVFLEKQSNMDLKIDALVWLDSSEVIKLNQIIEPYNYKPQRGNAWFYSIHCVYPYIFPIIKLTPAVEEKDDVITIGNHYEKFFNEYYSKREIIITKLITTLGLLREEYYEVMNVISSKKRKKKPNEYLARDRKYAELLLSCTKHDGLFIKRLAKLTMEFNEAEVSHFGNEEEYYYDNMIVKDFIEEIPLLKGEEELRKRFLRSIYEKYFMDLQYMFGTRTSIDFFEIAVLMQKNFCQRAITSKEMINFLFIDSDVTSVEDSKKLKDKKLSKSKRKKVENPENEVAPFLYEDEEAEYLKRTEDSLKPKPKKISKTVAPKPKKPKVNKTKQLEEERRKLEIAEEKERAKIRRQLQALAKKQETIIKPKKAAKKPKQKLVDDGPLVKEKSAKPKPKSKTSTAQKPKKQKPHVKQNILKKTNGKEKMVYRSGNDDFTGIKHDKINDITKNEKYNK